MLRRRASHDTVSPAPETAPVERPEPPQEANHLVVVVLDSLRYDSFQAAAMPNLVRLGEVERRWSYASWTAPSHYNLLMGLLPHRSPTHVYASEYYKEDFRRYTERLGVPGIEFQRLLPSLHLPTYLRDVLGYRTSAKVSMPVLNPATPINTSFDEYRLMPTHNDMAAMVDELRFDGDRPWFHLLNVGETHYPYALPRKTRASGPASRACTACSSTSTTRRPTTRAPSSTRSSSSACGNGRCVPRPTSTACSSASSTWCRSGPG